MNSAELDLCRIEGETDESNDYTEEKFILRSFSGLQYYQVLFLKKTVDFIGWSMINTKENKAVSTAGITPEIRNNAILISWPYKMIEK